MSDNRPTRYIELSLDPRVPSTVVYRASGVGGCVRAMVAAANGIQPREHQQWFQDVLDEGTRMESEIARQWAEQTGVPDVAVQPEVELEIGVIDGRRVIVRGHMDGLAFNNGPLREYKKFRASTYPNFQRVGVEANKNYPWQVSIYMHATGLPCEFVGGLYVPEQTDAHGNVRPEQIAEVSHHFYDTAPIPLKDIKLKVAKVERLVNGGYGADEVECSGGYPCAYWFLHDKKEVIEVAMDDWWRDKFAQWDEAKIDEKDAEAFLELRKAARKSIGAAMAERMVNAGLPAGEGGSIKVGDMTVTRVKSTVAERVQTVRAYELDYVKITAPKVKAEKVK